jgi:predicted KAP-like P-loop ATPase
VVGVHGAWGTGKTSVLNLIEHFLTHGSERSRVTVIRFNPWWFSTTSDGLLRAFFGQVIASLPTKTRALQKVRPVLATLANLLSKLPLGGFEGAAEGVGDLLDMEEPSVEALRKQIDKHVTSQRRRFVIIVDDLDRLPREDIYQMFRVVKAVADFPRFTYVMAFDPEIVGKALAHYVPDQGRSYIEKIVQVPFTMPEIEQERLDRVLFDGLEQILQPIDPDRFDKQRWGNTYYGGIRALVRSPRDIARLLDTLSVSYSAMRAEVDAIDFIALEALRVFVPDIHRAIAANPTMFGIGFRFQDDPKKDLAWHQSYLDKLPAEYVEAVKDLLKRTFPRLHAVWGNIHYGMQDAWRRDRRACSEDGFSLYFRWSVPQGRLTSNETRGIVSGTSDQIGAVLDRYLVGPPLEKLGRFRRLLMDLDPHMPKSHGRESAIPLCRQLIDRCDEASALDDPTTKGDMDLSLQWFVEKLVRRELERHPPAARTSFLLEACESSPSLAVIFSFLNELRLEHTGHRERAPAPEAERLVELEVVDRCVAVLRERVRSHAQGKTLLGLPQPGHVIVWWEAVDGEACRAWATDLAKDDQDLLRLLACFLRFSLVSSLEDRIGRAEPFIWMAYIRSLGLNPAALRDRVEQLGRSAQGKQRLAAETFVRQVDNPRAEPG